MKIILKNRYIFMFFLLLCLRINIFTSNMLSLGTVCNIGFYTAFLPSLGYSLYNTDKIKNKDLSQIPEKYRTSLFNSLTKHSNVFDTIKPISNVTSYLLENKNFKRFTDIFHEVGHLLQGLLHNNLAYYIANKKILFFNGIAKDKMAAGTQDNIFEATNPKVTLKILLVGYLSNIMITHMMKKNLPNNYAQKFIEQLLYSDSNLQAKKESPNNDQEISDGADFFRALAIIDHFNISAEELDSIVKETMDDLMSFVNLQILYSYYLFNNKEGKTYGKQFAHLPTITPPAENDIHQTTTYNIYAYGFNPLVNLKDLKTLEEICSLMVRDEKDEHIKNLVQHALKMVNKDEAAVMKNNKFFYSKRFDSIKHAAKLHWRNITGFFDVEGKKKRELEEKINKNFKELDPIIFHDNATDDFNELVEIFIEIMPKIIVGSVIIEIIFKLSAILNYYVSLEKTLSANENDINKISDEMKKNIYTYNVQKKITYDSKRARILIKKIKKQLMQLNNPRTSWSKKISLRWNLYKNARTLDTLLKDIKNYIH